MRWNKAFDGTIDSLKEKATSLNPRKDYVVIFFRILYNTWSHMYCNITAINIQEKNKVASKDGCSIILLNEKKIWQYSDSNVLLMRSFEEKSGTA